ncbi:MAG: PorT family protein [Candidatus Zixiibacteriota bacterium]|nr:MAG: PorT family protein [candidate division Zixibacteria bacterium]
MNKNNGLAAVCMIVIVMLAASVSSQPTVEIGLKTGLSQGTWSAENTGFVSTIRYALSDMDFTDDFAASSRMGFQAGGFVAVSMSKYFSIQPELILIKKGVSVEGSAVREAPSPDAETLTYILDERISLTYLEIPVLAKLTIPTPGNVRPSVYIGPAFAFNLSGSDDVYLSVAIESEYSDIFNEYEGNPDISNLKGSDVGLVFGGDLRIPSGSINWILDVRYTIGTSKLFDDVNPADIPEIDDEILPTELPIANHLTGTASDAKTRVLSVMLGVSIPL